MVERVLREPKAVRFRFVEEQRDQFPTKRLCQIMDVSARGYGLSAGARPALDNAVIW
jgi:hypothetical protein